MLHDYYASFKTPKYIMSLKRYRNFTNKLK